MKIGLVSAGFGLAFCLAISSSAFAERFPGACHTTQQYEHALAQDCNNGNSLVVLLDDARGFIYVDDVTGGKSGDPSHENIGPVVHETQGIADGPWIDWIDYNGNKCSTPQVLAEQSDFYPLTCPSP